MANKKTAGNLDVIDLYSSLLTEIWAKATELIGEGLLVFLVGLTIDRTSDKSSILNEIRVSEAGISLEAVRRECRDVPPEDVHRAFQGLVKNLFDAFKAIAENVINRELFSTVLPRLREVEKTISR